MQNYDIKAWVTNKRESGNFFANGYRPAFQIKDDYLTSGEIILVDKEVLNVNETAEAYIRFLTPEFYPNSLCVGQKIIFKEGKKITGEIVIIEIYNQILKLK